MPSRRLVVLLGLALAAYFTTLFSRMVLSPVVPDIIATLDSSKSAIGLAFTGMWAAYAVTQYPAGVLADRFGEKRLVLVSVGATAATSLLLALSFSYLYFLAMAVLIGASAGLYAPAGTSLLTKRFSNTGQALGFHVAGANLAGLVAPVAAAFVAVRIGWRVAPLLSVLVAVPVFVLVAWFVRPTPPEDPDTAVGAQFTPGAVLGIMTRPSVAFTAAVGVIGIFTFNAIASFLPTFLIEFWGLSTTRAGTAFGVVYLFSAATMPVMGKVSDYVNRDYAVMASMAGVGTGLTLLIVGRTVVPALLAVVIVGTGISWAGSLQSRYMDLLADAERGTGFGLIRATTGLLGSVGSVIVGAVAEFAGWAAAYGLVVGLLAVAVLALGANRLVGPGW